MRVRKGTLVNFLVYAALRSLDNRDTIRGRPADVARGATSRQENYAQMLSLFAETLQKQSSLLLFVSVTHGHGDNTYHYDIDHFPMIKGEVTRLEAAGLLRFVELPTSEMQQYPGSPEGHQWSAQHHRAVARAIANEILSPDPVADRPQPEAGPGRSDRLELVSEVL